MYYQLGRTINYIVKRTAFYDPREIVDEVRDFLMKWSSDVDCIMLVSDDEPLLDERADLLIADIKEVDDKPVAGYPTTLCCMLRRLGRACLVLVSFQ
ncbi:MAG: hypothetical protein QXT75_07185 [Desulfurococcaceae archaeon]